MKRVLILLSVCIVLSGCSVLKKKQTPETPVSSGQTTITKPEKQTTNQKENITTAPYNTVSCKIKGTYNGISFSGVMRSAYDSIIWLSVTELGLEVARAELTEDSVYFIDKFNKKAVVSDYNRNMPYIGMKINFAMAQRLLTDTVSLQKFNKGNISATIIKTHLVTSGIPFPKTINVSGIYNNKQHNLSLKISDVKFNIPLSYPLDIPKGYKIK